MEGRNRPPRGRQLEEANRQFKADNLDDPEVVAANTLRTLRIMRGEDEHPGSYVQRTQFILGRLAIVTRMMGESEHEQ